MSELNVVSAGIYAALAAGTALRNMLAAGTLSIYNTQAIENASFPYVVFSLQASTKLNETPSDQRDDIIFIRGYSKTSMAAAGSIDAAVSNLIDGKTLAISGYTNYWTARESGVSTTENMPDGGYCWMAGAMYRLRIDA